MNQRKPYTRSDLLSKSVVVGFCLVAFGICVALFAGLLCYRECYEIPEGHFGVLSKRVGGRGRPSRCIAPDS